MKEVETIQKFLHNIHTEKWGVSYIPRIARGMVILT